MMRGFDFLKLRPWRWPVATTGISRQTRIPELPAAGSRPSDPRDHEPTQSEGTPGTHRRRREPKLIEAKLIQKITFDCQPVSLMTFFNFAN